MAASKTRGTATSCSLQTCMSVPVHQQCSSPHHVTAFPLRQSPHHARAYINSQISYELQLFGDLTKLLRSRKRWRIQPTSTSGCPGLDHCGPNWMRIHLSLTSSAVEPKSLPGCACWHSGQVLAGAVREPHQRGVQQQEWPQ